MQATGMQAQHNISMTCWRACRKLRRTAWNDGGGRTAGPHAAWLLMQLWQQREHPTTHDTFPSRHQPKTNRPTQTKCATVIACQKVAWHPTAAVAQFTTKRYHSFIHKATDREKEQQLTHERRRKTNLPPAAAMCAVTAHSTQTKPLLSTHPYT